MLEKSSKNSNGSKTFMILFLIYYLSLGDVLEIGAAWKFFISFRGFIEAILLNNFFETDEF